MTVADNTSRNQYTATSGQTVFAYTFEIVDKDDVVVLKNGTTLSEGTDYTVSNVGNDSGGNVTLTVGATAGDILTLYRDMPYSRTQNYTNSGDFLASEVNSDFDNLWLAGEQTQRSFSQSIRKPITDSDSISMELPVASSRAGKYLTFDSTGAVSTQDASTVTTLTRQNFTGDGSTTAFTLSTAPESTGGNLQIYIDGVHQENSAYSVSGSVVTFTAAPPINSAIEVVAFATGSIGSTTADLVTYTPAGTGAVDTTVQTKLRESVSVKDFGAVGDGVTDDTAAIQSAEAASDCIIFSNDTYYMGTSAWKPTAEKTYIFQDTTLLFDVASDAAVQIGMRTHFLGHLTIDANEATSSVALRFGPESGGVIGPCYDSTVDIVRVTGFTSVGIQFRSDGNSGAYYNSIEKAEIFNRDLDTSSAAAADASALPGIGIEFVTDTGVAKVNSNYIGYATVLGYTTGVKVNNAEGNAFSYLNAETNLTMNLDIVNASGFFVGAGRLENKCSVGFAGNLSIADGTDATGITINAVITGFDQPTGALSAINFSNLRSIEINQQRYKYLLGRTFTESIEIGDSGSAGDDSGFTDRLRIAGGQYCYRNSSGNPYYFFTAPTDGVGYIFRDNGSRNLARIDGGDPSGGNSSLAILVNDGTNPVRIETVKIGGVDSGGTGYRALIINNS